MLSIILNKVIIITFSIFLFHCAPSPRYKASSSNFVKNNTVKSSKPSNKKQKSLRKDKAKFNTSKMLYKGISSYYGPKFHGKLTANGEIFDMYGVTAAHKEFPFNTITRVTNEKNGKSLIIRINDRGPYIDGRILDCSFGAAKKLGFVTDGTAPVKIEIIEWGDGEYMHHD